MRAQIKESLAEQREFVKLAQTALPAFLSKELLHKLIH
jgi:hypothetical protein